LPACIQVEVLFQGHLGGVNVQKVEAFRLYFLWRTWIMFAS